MVFTPVYSGTGGLKCCFASNSRGFQLERFDEKSHLFRGKHLPYAVGHVRAGHDDDPHFGTFDKNFPGNLQAVHAGHLDIHQDAAQTRRGKSFLPGFCAIVRQNNLIVRLKQFGIQLAQHFFVVGDEDEWLLRHRL
jgi:hypothetical protein